MNNLGVLKNVTCKKKVRALKLANIRQQDVKATSIFHLRCLAYRFQSSKLLQVSFFGDT